MRIVFLGPPGAGKGTLAKRLEEEKGITQISTGEIFRDAIRKKTDLGKQIEELINNGDLVPDKLTVEIVKAALKQHSKNVSFDGFPRTIFQAEALETFFPVDSVVSINVDEKEVVRRISGRRQCPNCKAGYHIEFMPPETSGTCDKCGTKLITRKDDEVTSVKHRLEVYHAQTEDLIVYYKEKGLLLNVNGNPHPEQAYSNLLKALNL